MGFTKIHDLKILRIRRMLLTVAVVMVVTSIGTGCSGSTNEPRLVGASASSIIPGNTIEDWVSYGDSLAVISVVSETKLDPIPGVYERGEGYVGREVTLNIEEVLWQRDGGPDIPRVIHPRTSGWILKNGVLNPMTYHGAARLEVGQRYLIAFALFEAEDGYPDGVWANLNPRSVFPVENDLIADFDMLNGTIGNRVALELMGKSVVEVAGMVRDTPSNPVALKYGSLNARDRFNAANAELTGPLTAD